jgi:TolA-binding protein
MGTMNMTTGEPKDSPTLAQATELCRDKLGPPSAAELERGLDSFLERLAPNGPRPRRWVRWSLVGATVALCALVVFEVAPVLRSRWFAPAAPTLAYRIEGGTVLEGGYLRESGHAGMNVLFNEGSRLELAPGTRSRIRVVDRDGAHVGIERGKASFRVAHKNDRRWLVDVGPFLVTVTGTVFTVSWDPLREELDLRLQEGSVVVSGPVSAGEIKLRAGQRLVANLAKVETVITEETPGSAALAPAGTSPAPAPPPPATQPAMAAPSAAVPAPVAARRPNDHHWSSKVARGEWDRILAEAQRIGIEATLGEASSEDLFALANAARFRHRFDLARSALLAERRRFAGSPRTLETTYLLGRVEESQDSGTAQAIAWYDEYLAKAPTGPLAGEALGRKMTLTDKLEGPARARSLAEEYLRRFPKGNYAASARELLAP